MCIAVRVVWHYYKSFQKAEEEKKPILYISIDTNTIVGGIATGRDDRTNIENGVWYYDARVYFQQ